MRAFNTAVRMALAAAAVAAIGGCQNLPSVSGDQGTLIGAGTGALAGALIGDGGVILPALGAVGGAVIGEEVAENDPVFD